MAAMGATYWWWSRWVSYLHPKGMCTILRWKAFYKCNPFLLFSRCWWQPHEQARQPALTMTGTGNFGLCPMTHAIRHRCSDKFICSFIASDGHFQWIDHFKIISRTKWIEMELNPNQVGEDFTEHNGIQYCTTGVNLPVHFFSLGGCRWEEKGKHSRVEMS